jgi:cardiolipin synthase
MGLTMLRLLLLPVFLWLLLRDAGLPDEPRPNRRWAVAVFALMALTDKLDGYLARRLGQASQLGAILDPVADKLLLMISLILLSSERIAPSGYAIPLWVVGAVYLKDLLIVFGTLFVLARVRGVHVQARMLGKIGTALQLCLVLLTLLAPDLAGLLPGRVTPLTLHWTGVGVAVVAAASVVDYVMAGGRMVRGVPRP